MQATPLEFIVLTKSLGHWLSTSLPLALAAPFLGVLLNVASVTVWPLLAAMLLGSLSLSLLATVGAALTLNLRRGGLLISLLVLPLYVPLLVFGMAAATATPEVATASLLILSAIALASMVLAPLAAAAALRTYLK